MIQITKSRTVFRGTDKDLTKLNTHFLKHGYVRLPGLLSEPVLDFLLSRIKLPRFKTRVHPDIGSELLFTDPLLAGAMHTFLNEPELLSVIRSITGCMEIRAFKGRVYRMLPNKHHDDWHDDNVEGRRAALSINLSPSHYEGGNLEIRSRTQWIGKAVPNRGLGNAVLFALSKTLEHRVCGVSGKVPKTAYAGWFHTRRQKLPWKS